MFRILMNKSLLLPLLWLVLLLPCHALAGKSEQSQFSSRDSTQLSAERERIDKDPAFSGEAKAARLSLAEILFPGREFFEVPTSPLEVCLQTQE